jgi:4-aminobutyrate aminotransferase/(S)-3-amino-2-methylpropionate transaminase
MQDLDLAGAARRIGEIVTGRLEVLQGQLPAIGEIRGRGAMQAIELVKPGTREPDAAAAARVAAACHAEGVIVLTCGTWGNVIRLLPPLTIQADLLVEGLEVLEAAARVNLA